MNIAVQKNNNLWTITICLTVLLLTVENHSWLEAHFRIAQPTETETSGNLKTQKSKTLAPEDEEEDDSQDQIIIDADSEDENKKDLEEILHQTIQPTNKALSVNKQTKGQLKSSARASTQNGAKITADWKLTTSMRYISNLEEISRAVLHGETDAVFKQKISQKFADQQKNFETNMRIIAFENDGSHKEVMELFNTIENLAKFYRKARSVLEMRLQELDLSSRQVGQLHANLVYELSDALSKEGSLDQPIKLWSQEQFEHLVNNLLQKNIIHVRDGLGIQNTPENMDKSKNNQPHKIDGKKETDKGEPKSEATKIEETAIQKAQEIVGKAEDKAIDWEVKNRKLQIELQHAGKDYHELKEQFQQLNARLQKEMAAKLDLETQLTKNREELSGKQRDLIRIQTELNNAQSDMEREHKSKIGHDVNAQSLQMLLYQNQQRVKELEEAQRNLETKLKFASDKNSELNLDLAKSKDSLNAIQGNSETQLQEAKRQIAKLEGDWQYQQQQAKATQDRLVSLQVDMERLKREKEVLTDDLAQSRLELETSRRKHDEVVSQLTANSQQRLMMEVKLARQQQDRADLEAKYQEVIQQLKEIQAETKDYQRQLNKLQKKGKNKDKGLDKVVSQQEKVEQQLSHLVENVVPQLKQQAEAGSLSNEQLYVQCAKLQAKVDDLKGANEKLSANFQEMQKQRTDLDAQIQTLKQMHMDKGLQIQHLQAVKDKVEHKLSQLRADYSLKSQEAEHMASERDILRKQLSTVGQERDMQERRLQFLEDIQHDYLRQQKSNLEDLEFTEAEIYKEKTAPIPNSLGGRFLDQQFQQDLDYQILDAIIIAKGRKPESE